MRRNLFDKPTNCPVSYRAGFVQGMRETYEAIHATAGETPDA